MEELLAQIQAMTAGLGGLGDSLNGFTSQQDAANNGLKQGRDDMGRFTAAGSGAQSTMGQAFESFAGGANKAADAIHSLGAGAMSVLTGQIPSTTQAASMLGNALESGITGAADKAGEALSKLGPEGEAAGAAIEALGAVVGATVGQLTTLAGVAIDVNEKLDVMSARFEALTGSSKGGDAAFDTVMKLGQNLPFATSQVEGWATSLLKAGVSAGQLESRLKAVAAAEAFGAGGGAAAETLFKRLGEGGAAADQFLKELQKNSRRAWEPLRGMGITMKDLGGDAAVAKMNAKQLSDVITQAMTVKGAGPLEALGNTLPVILSKAQEGLRSLFDGLEPSIKPFMASVKSFFGEFNKGGVAINTLKPIVTSVFGTMFEVATWAFNAIHKGFLYLVIGGLTVYIALRPIINAFRSLFASTQFITGLKIALALLAVPLVLIAGLVAVLAIPFVVAGIVIFAFVTNTIRVLGILYDWISDFVGMIGSSGSAIIDGLVGSIDIGAFIDKMGGLAKAGLEAFKGVFGIASPSRVMLEHGQEDIAEEGLGAGVEKGATKVKASFAKLREGATAGGKVKALGAAGASGGGEVHNHYHYSGPIENYGRFREYMQRFLEEVAMEAGAAPGQS
jgi:hypothetical protein